MKSARSEGGPFIIMDSALAPYWGGVMHKGFMDRVYDGASDYDALCAMLNLPEYTRKGIVTFQSRIGQALILEMPFEAAIILDDPARACIVQAHYSDPDWSAEDISLSALDLLNQQDLDSAEVNFGGSKLVIFDSTCDYNHFEQSITSIDLMRGTISAKYYMSKLDDRTLVSVTDLRVR